MFKKLLLLIGLCTVPAWAQPNAVSDVSITLIATSVHGSLENVKYVSAGRVQPLEVLGSYLGKPATYSGPPEIEFFHETPGADGKPTRKIVAQGKLASSAPRQLLVFFPTGKGSAPYGFISAPFTNKEIPPGSLRLINLTGMDLMILFGETRMPASPGSVLDLRPQTTGTQGTRLAIAANVGSGFTKSFDSVIFCEAEVRNLYIITPSGARPGHVSVNQIIDTTPAESTSTASR